MRVPEPVTLADLLNEPDDEPTYRIDRLLPTGGRVVFAAQRKAGKTTATGNLLRSLADGEPFLGQFGVQPALSGPVVLIDDELDRRMIRRWLRDQGIEHTDRVIVWPIRGMTGTFNILDDETRAAWADAISGLHASFVILDCLRPVLDAIGLDESRDAGRFLVAFDALLKAANVPEAAVIHHMGHNGERSRGDSRIRDWPDAEWRLVNQGRAGEEPDPAAPRYFSAFGRDVDVPEGALTFDRATRRLTLAGGSRKDATTEAALEAVRDVLTAADEPLSGRAIEGKLRGGDHTQSSIRAALKAGTARGDIVTQRGAGRAVLHSPNPSSALMRGSALPVRQRAVSECVDASIDNALTRTTRPATQCVMDGCDAPKTGTNFCDQHQTEHGGNAA